MSLIIGNGIVILKSEFLYLAVCCSSTQYFRHNLNFLLRLSLSLSLSSPSFPTCPEMMSVLYNFVKADTNAFLSNPKHIEIILAMCKQVSIVHFVGKGSQKSMLHLSVIGNGRRHCWHHIYVIGNGRHKCKLLVVYTLSAAVYNIGHLHVL